MKMRAGALYLALTVSFLSTGVLFAFFLMFYNQVHYTNRALRYEKSVHLIEQGLVYYLLNSTTFSYDKQDQRDVFGQGNDYVSFYLYHWGVYDKIELATFSGVDTLRKNFLIGSHFHDKEPPSLYITDRGEIVSIATNVKLFGNVYLPKGMYKTIYSSPNNFSSSAFTTKNSDSKLPSIDIKKKDYLVALLKNPGKASISSDSIYYDKVFNFSVPVLIRNNYKLINCIVVAPSITVENNFQGIVQLIASDSIKIGENVKLKYPSGVILNKLKQAPNFLQIQAGFSIDGVVMSLDHVNMMEKSNVSIADRSIIKGILYSDAKTKLQGAYIAPVYVELMETENGVNTIDNIILEYNKLNKNYVYPVLFPNTKKVRIF